MSLDIKSLTSLSSRNNPPLIPSSKYSENSKIRSDIQKLINKLLSDSLAKEVAQKACKIVDPLYGKTGPFQIEYCPEDCYEFGTIAFTDHTYRKIVLSTLEEKLGLHTLIFEVCNASQTIEYRKIQEKVKDRSIKASDYAKEIVRIEFNSHRLSQKIYKSGIANAKWNKKLDVIKKDLSKLNFEEHVYPDWPASHIQHYIDQYEIIVKGDCKKKVISIAKFVMYSVVFSGMIKIIYTSSSQ